MSAAVYARTGCVVLGCHRTSARFPGEWICGPHWRLVDAALKRLRTRLMRRCRLAYEASQTRRAYDRWVRTEAAVWRRMKRQAIERAAGITA